MTTPLSDVVCHYVGLAMMNLHSQHKVNISTHYEDFDRVHMRCYYPSTVSRHCSYPPPFLRYIMRHWLKVVDSNLAHLYWAPLLGCCGDHI